MPSYLSTQRVPAWWPEEKTLFHLSGRLHLHENQRDKEKSHQPQDSNAGQGTTTVFFSAGTGDHQDPGGPNR